MDFAGRNGKNQFKDKTGEGDAETWYFTFQIAAWKLSTHRVRLPGIVISPILCPLGHLPVKWKALLLLPYPSVVKYFR